MTSPPLASVIVPTFNGSALLPETLQSVLQQSFGNLELILVDDGSTDATPDLLRSLQRDHPNLRVISQLNAGMSAARNRGIVEASGDFLALLDHDDLWPGDHLQWQVDRLRDHPHAVMIYGNVQKMNLPTPDRLPDSPAVQGFDYFARGCPLVSPGQALFRTAAVRRVGGLDQALWGTDDWDLYLRLAKEGDILYEDRLALLYRVHEQNSSRNFMRMYRNGMRVVEKHFPTDICDDGLRAAAISSVHGNVARLGITHVIAMRRQRRLLAMLTALAKVIWIQPSILQPRGIARRMRHVLIPKTPRQQ